VNWSGSAEPGIAVLSLDGVAQQAPEATSSSNCLDCTTISTNITTLTDGAWVVSNVGNGRTFTYTGHGSGQVERWDQNPGSATHSGTTRSVATAGLVSISETASGEANRQAHVVAAFAPAFVPDLYILSRDSATEVTVQQNATSSQSNGTYTIERAYNTMQAWEDDRDGDLVTETRREIGVCYNDGAFTDRLVISGSTTSASYYMRLTVAAGERHNGVRDSGARIDAGGGFIPSQNAINVEDEYTRIEWLEITDVVDGRDAIFLDDDPAADHSTVAGVFVHGFWQNSNAAFRVEADNVTIRNCFATGGTTYAARIESSGSVMIENCTFWGSLGGYGVYGVAGSDVGVRNTISVDHGSLDMYIGTGGGATISYFGYNLFITYGGGFDPDDVAYAGNNQSPPVNLERLFADLSTSDLHLELTGHRAGNRGLDLSSSFTGDIDGTTRTVTWDIGAHEGVPGTAPLPPKIVRWAEVEPQ
jgi:hypothetical protein